MLVRRFHQVAIIIGSYLQKRREAANIFKPLLKQKSLPKAASENVSNFQTLKKTLLKGSPGVSVILINFTLVKSSVICFRLHIRDGCCVRYEIPVSVKDLINCTQIPQIPSVN